VGVDPAEGGAEVLFEIEGKDRLAGPGLQRAAQHLRHEVAVLAAEPHGGVGRRGDAGRHRQSGEFGGLHDEDSAAQGGQGGVRLEDRNGGVCHHCS
jgi:hypothetical protein